ncbi:phosphatase PAP2 family protein [Mycobacterium sp. URHB0021]|jgi:membrane-associated phospholipid phosphatase
MTPPKSWLIGSALSAVAIYALMWIGYTQGWNWLNTIDSSALDAFHRHGVDHPGWVIAWNVFCTAFGPTAFRLASLVIIVIALVRRNLRLAMFLVISVELSGLITEIAKAIANRPRPETAMVFALSTSFPSGHALGVMVGVLALLTVVLPLVRQTRWPWIVALGLVVVIAVGVGRVVLNVHYPSDVLAGWALGYAYFAGCLLLVPPTRPVTEADEIPEAPGIAR